MILLIAPLVIWAANFQNIATQVIEPDGTFLNLLASGDEYVNWLHDEKDFTIVQNPTDGYYYYAILHAGEPVPSTYRVGLADPEQMNLQPGIRVSEATYRSKVSFMQRLHETRPNRRAPNTGTVNNLNVFIRFSDQTEFEDPRSTFDAKFNPIGDEDYSLRNYFRKVSYNQLDYVTHHYPVCATDINLSYQDPQTRSYYMPYNQVTNPNGYMDSQQRAYREHTLLANAINFIAPQVPADLDIDADNDGLVDNVCFIIRGPHTAWADLLWAHRWVLYYTSAYINGKEVWDYTFQPENHNNTRTLCHEMFHSVGAPDLYHYTFNGITPTGCWDIMESGYGHMGAWMKFKYGGWIDNITTINTAGYYTLATLTSATNNAYKIPITGTNNDFFILEYRKQESDIFEQNLPGSGLLIYRIRSSLQGNADGPPDEVYIYRPNGDSNTNGLIFEATFSADSYRTAFNNWTNPNCFLIDNSLANLNISDVSVIGESISFYYNPQNTAIPPQITINAPADGSVLPSGIIELSATVSHPHSEIVSVSFQLDGQFIGVADSEPYTINWDAGNVPLGMHQLVVTALTDTGESNMTQSTFRTLNPAEENWFGWITSDPVYEEFGRGIIPIKIAIDLDLGDVEYLVRKLAFHIESDPWGEPLVPGLVSATINRFGNGAITNEILLNLGDIYVPMTGRYEHDVDLETTISGKIAVVIDIREYKKMLFDNNGICGHSWITETNRPWTDAIARGVVGSAIIELLLQAPQTGLEEYVHQTPKVTISSYPNPFNPLTNISFNLLNAADIELSVYNMRGQKVFTLLQEFKVKGTHSVSWNGVDASGKAVGSGIYFLKLSSRNKSLATKKIVLTK